MPGLLLPTSSKSKSKAVDAWSFSFRGGYESDSSESEGGKGEGNTEGGGESRCLAQLTDDAKLMKELDIASRAEADAAQFKANPWSIARVNAASRNTDANAEDVTCSANSNNLAQEHTRNGNTKTHESINKQSKLSSSAGQMTIAVPAGRSSAPLGRLKKPAQASKTGKAKPSSTIQRFLAAASDAVVRDGRKDVLSNSRSITSDARRPSASPATIDRSDSTKPSKFSHASDPSFTPTTINDIVPRSIPADPGTDSSMTKEMEGPDTLLTCDDTTTGALTNFHAFSDEPGLIYSDNNGELQYGGRSESITSGPVTLLVGPGLDSNRPIHTSSNSATTQGGLPETASGAWLIRLMDECHLLVHTCTDIEMQGPP